MKDREDPQGRARVRRAAGYGLDCSQTAVPLQPETMTLHVATAPHLLLAVAIAAAHFYAAVQDGFYLYGAFARTILFYRAARFAHLSELHPKVAFENALLCHDLWRTYMLGACRLALSQMLHKKVTV